MRRLWRLPAALLMLVVPSLSGCGDSTDSGTSPAGAAGEVAAAAVTGGATEIVFEVEEGDGSFAFDAVESAPGGAVKVTLKNTGTQTHELQLLEVTEGTTYETLEEAILADGGTGAGLATVVGKVGGGVGRVSPGETVSTFENLPAGNYLYFCTVLANEDTNHADLGMSGTLTITDATQPGTEAPPAATTESVVASEYGFAIDGLQAGRQTLTWDNPGKEWHHLVAAPMADGATIDDVRDYVIQEVIGGDLPETAPANFNRAANLPMIGPGQTTITDIDLAPGRYVLVCFLRDRAGGMPHFLSGMLQELTVT